MELLCDRGVRQIFSDDFLFDNDSKRVPEKIFQHEPKSEWWKSFGTIFESLSYWKESENICQTTRLHCKCIIFEIFEIWQEKISWRCKLYTVAQNKPDSTNQAIVSCCESYFKNFFYAISEPYVRKVLEISFIILGLQLCLNYIFSEISQCIKYTCMTQSKT